MHVYCKIEGKGEIEVLQLWKDRAKNCSLKRTSLTGYACFRKNTRRSLLITELSAVFVMYRLLGSMENTRLMFIEEIPRNICSETLL